MNWPALWTVFGAIMGVAIFIAGGTALGVWLIQKMEDRGYNELEQMFVAGGLIIFIVAVALGVVAGFVS